MQSNSKKMTLGIILLVLGFISISVGIIFIKKSNQLEPTPTVSTTPTTTPEIVEAPKKDDSEKEKGEAFEKFVVQKFSKTYFSVKEWRSDKFVSGHYAESTSYPDLTMEFKLREQKELFAVECKYRSDYFKEGVEWCKEHQLKNYQKFAQENKMPVFVVIGIGNSAHSPADLYCIPLKALKETFVSKSFLQSYQKHNFQETNFFYDSQHNTLK
ncbi:hypothetical protein [Flectobacillus sp. BAB-3569]|uniref:hypothetical protein n=1 Tax=Flectobacillus sp. BAB-3569 TaxID=1509483 RepID=UPI000BA4915C|nr:hypothetical protein [Flectobacillus sp. BAB-3569]PAC31476.1 hypothetical protein BWI92_09075 [Flectobacillus sp. BAB-3569]